MQVVSLEGLKHGLRHAVEGLEHTLRHAGRQIVLYAPAGRQMARKWFADELIS